MKKLLILFLAFMLLGAANCHAQIHTTVRNASCHDYVNGTIRIDSATGLAAPVSYNLQPGNMTGNSFQNLAAGSYTLTATDVNNQVITKSIVLSQPPKLKIDSISKVIKSCGTSLDITVHANGGTGTLSYAYANTNSYYNMNSNVLNNYYGGTFPTIVGPTNPFANLVFRVVDANQCSDVVRYEIPPISVGPTIDSIVTTKSSCFNTASGSLQIYAHGNSTLNYSINSTTAGNANGYFAGLTEGLYTVTVQDSSGCATAKSVYIFNDNSQINIASITHDSANCINYNHTGAVSFSHPLQHPPYTYKLSSNFNRTNNIGSFDSLPTYSYTLFLTDSAGCQTTKDRIYIKPSLELLPIFYESIGCDSIKIKASPEGLFPPITTTLNNFYTSTNGEFIVPRGIYTISVSDALSCNKGISTLMTTYEPISLSKYNPPIIIFSTENTSKQYLEKCSGVFDLGIKNGIPPYTIMVYDTNYNLQNTFTQRVEFDEAKDKIYQGNFIIVGQDSGACSRDTIYVNVLPKSNDEIIIKNISTTNLCNNYANVQVSGANGNTPYTYYFNSKTNTTGIFDSVPTNIVMYISMTDSLGCGTNDLIYIPPQINNIFGAITTQHAACTNNQGEIHINAAADLSGISFAILPNLGTQTSPGHFIGLSSGSYTITATDAYNCSSTTLINILNQSNIIFNSVQSVPTTCNANNGQIIISASGNSFLNYSINSVPVTTTTGTFIGLAPGNYVISVIDGNSCSRTTSVTIIATPPPNSVSVSKTNVLCHGDSTGSIQINVNGGTQPFNYTSTPFLGSLPWNHVPAGTYSITLADANNCSISTQVTITEPAQMLLVIPENAIGYPSCNPSHDGWITPLVNGGTSPHTFYSNNVIINPTNYKNLDTGLYVIKVVDFNQCSATRIVQLKHPYPIIDSFFINPKICKYVSFASIGIYTTNSSASFATFTQISTGLPTTSSNLDSGYYAIVLLDPNTKCQTLDTAYVPFIPKLFPLDNSTIINESCPGSNDGSITFSNNQFPVFSYEITPQIGNRPNSKTFTNLAKGTYAITGENTYGCVGRDTLEVGILEDRDFFYSTTKSSNIHCYGSVNAKAIGGIGIYTYAIEPNTGREIEPGFFDGLCWGNYLLRATDSAGCFIDQAFTIVEDLNAPKNIFSHFKIYPNPADDILYFESDYLFEYQVSLINLFGQIIKTKKIHDKLSSISVSDVTPGMYIIRFKTDVDLSDVKILIAR